FPLLNNTPHAMNEADLVHESPALLDPCSRDDVGLLAFSPDGRPVVSPAYAGNADARLRVEKSNLLLNLDYPTFNEGREELYNKLFSWLSGEIGMRVQKISLLMTLRMICGG
ncbi:MAG: hypothetical protein Q8J78_09560, partial [Moraxellaceae bacterium]|nr:hypothetical protein [Moraxellaceae bacterium]